jgi:hypothetical protein
VGTLKNLSGVYGIYSLNGKCSPKQRPGRDMKTKKYFLNGNFKKINEIG